jgi:hypothetical protein
LRVPMGRQHSSHGEDLRHEDRLGTHLKSGS